MSEKQLGISGIDIETYKHAMKEVSRDRFMTAEDKILFSLAVQTRNPSHGIRVMDRDRLLSTTLRWEREKGAGWMMCCQLIKDLLGEHAAKSQCPDGYDKMI